MSEAEAYAATLDHQNMLLWIAHREAVRRAKLHGATL